MPPSLELPRPDAEFDAWLRHIRSTGPLTLERAVQQTADPGLKASRSAFMRRKDRERAIFVFEHPEEYHRRRVRDSSRQHRPIRDLVAAVRKNNPSYYLWELSKKRSDVRHERIPFTIKPTDIEVPHICPIMQKPLTRERGQKGPMSPTLHLVQWALGYVPGNIVVLSWVASDYLVRLPVESTLGGVLLSPRLDYVDRWQLTCPHGHTFLVRHLDKAKYNQERPYRWCSRCKPADYGGDPRRGPGVP